MISQALVDSPWASRNSVPGEPLRGYTMSNFFLLAPCSQTRCNSDRPPFPGEADMRHVWAPALATRAAPQATKQMSRLQRNAAPDYLFFCGSLLAIPTGPLAGFLAPPLSREMYTVLESSKSYAGLSLTLPSLSLCTYPTLPPKWRCLRASDPPDSCALPRCNARPSFSWPLSCNRRTRTLCAPSPPLANRRGPSLFADLPTNGQTPKDWRPPTPVPLPRADKELPVIFSCDDV